MKENELIIHSKNLQCALYAYKGGADSVIVNVRQLNGDFPFEDLRKLKTVSLREEKTFYIAFDSLLSNEQLKESLKELKIISFLEPAGVIVQDLGLASLIKQYYPSLVLYASEKLRICSASGVLELANLGFNGVFLFPELSFDEICTIKESCQGIKLKTFVHGNIYEGYSNVLSIKDLSLGREILKLENAGLDSFVIAAHFRESEFCFWASRYYSLLLSESPDSKPSIELAKEAMEVSFSRSHSSLFFDNSEDYICSDYPFHRGIKIGKIKKILNKRAVVSFLKPAAVRDTLLVYAGQDSSGFPLSNLSTGKSYVSENETVEIDFPTDSFKTLPKQETDVWCIKRINQKFDELSENIRLFSSPIKLEVVIKENSILLNTFEYPINVEKAKGNFDLQPLVSKVFESNDRSLFYCDSVSVVNETEYEKPFVSLSELKTIRRSFFKSLDLNFLKEDSEVKLPAFESMISIENTGCVSLNPLVTDEKAYFEKLDEKTRSKPQDFVGINNLNQVIWAKNNPNLKVFADELMNVRNSLSLEVLKKEIPNLIGWYGSGNLLFVSRVCFARYILNLSCEHCLKDRAFDLVRDSEKYTVKCYDCLSLVFEDDK